MSVGTKAAALIAFARLFTIVLAPVQATWMPALWALTILTIVGGNIFTVTNNNDSGAGSLRQAITDANNHAGADTIEFNISGGGVHTITLASALPSVTDPAVIDGSTQPG